MHLSRAHIFAHLVTFAMLGMVPLDASAKGLNCPTGSRPNGETTPEVREAWCEVIRDGKVVQHGPSKTWWPNGKLASTGQYNYGVPVGKWTGWFPSGKLQGEEWFEAGVRVKARYFDESGKPAQKLVTPRNVGEEVKDTK